MKNKFKQSQERFEDFKDRNRDENGSFGVCFWEMENNITRLECWNTDKFGMRIYQIYANGNGFTEWEQSTD